MPTRDEASCRIRQDLADSGITPADYPYEFVLETLETMNRGIADLDDELADIASLLLWLANAQTWITQRNLTEFDGFVEAELRECESAVAAIRYRWEQHRPPRRVGSGAPS